KESVFAKNFTKTKPALTQPEFIDYKKAIQYTTLPNGLSIAHVQNKKSNLFQLDVIFDMGKSADKKIPLAVNYINSIGTVKYSSADWKKEFYKLGLSYTFNARN